MTTQILTRLALTAATTLAATSVVTALPEAAHALTVTRTINGTAYDIATIEGTFNDLQSTLTNTATAPWWDDFWLTRDFVSAVGDSLGLPNGDNEGGPYFAYVESEYANRAFGHYFRSTTSNVVAWGGGSDEIFTYATATETTPVPTPALLPGLVGMGVAALRKRKQETEAKA